MFRDVEKTDFCYYPFMQILLSSDGKYRPCSKHQDYITHEGKELNAATSSIEEAWNSDYMQDIRQSFMDNKQFKGCSECWRMQKMGLRSMRYDSYQYETPDEQVLKPLKPTRIELNASNVCNLRCRICYPNASNKWIKEYKDLYGKEEKVYYNLNEKNVEDIKNWAEHLQEICFFGGEPLLSKENFQLLDYLIEKDLAKNISVLFNTNGTIFTDEIAKKLEPFKHVRMYFSIDDIGERFEYQRKGAKWDAVEKNIAKAYNLSRSERGKNIDFKICTTLSIFNTYYLPEFFQYFEKNYPGLRIFWNLLFDPWRLNIQILPEEVKAVIEKRLRQGVQTSYTRTEADTRTTEELIVFLNEKVEKPFEEFFRYVNRHDRYRKERFYETFPELYKLIEPHTPSYLNWGEIDGLDELNIHNQIEALISQFLSLRTSNKSSSDATTFTSELRNILNIHYNQNTQSENYILFNRYKRYFKDTPYGEVFFNAIMFKKGKPSTLESFALYTSILKEHASTMNLNEEEEFNFNHTLNYLYEVLKNDSSSTLYADTLPAREPELIHNFSHLLKEKIGEKVCEQYPSLASSLPNISLMTIEEQFDYYTTNTKYEFYTRDYVSHLLFGTAEIDHEKLINRVFEFFKIEATKQNRYSEEFAEKLNTIKAALLKDPQGPFLNHMLQTDVPLFVSSVIEMTQAELSEKIWAEYQLS